MQQRFRQLFPTRWLLLLLAIGFVDLIVTALLHQQGLIVELNPLMRPIIETSEWLFAGVKALTLLLAWVVILKFSQTHLEFIKRACAIGSGAYLSIWTLWFIVGSLQAA